MPAYAEGVRVDLPESLEQVTSRSLDACRTTFDIYQFLKCSSHAYGYGNFTMFLTGSGLTESLSDALVCSNWPNDLIRTYDDLGLFPHSPIIRHLRTSGLPMRWRIGDCSEDTPWFRHAPRLFAQYGIDSGVCFPVFHGEMRGSIGMQGDRDDIGDDDFMRLSLVSALVFRRFCELRPTPPARKDALSRREVECLVWTAAGKTSAEIALILSLSDHTVNHYLGSATQKLGAVTKAQAVAIAMRNKIIA